MCTLPAARWLEAPCAGPGSPADRQLERLAALADRLEWRQTYSLGEVGAYFLERYAWARLIGPDGPVGCERLRVGWLLLGAELEYPAHRHEAEEVYVPLTGPTWWRAGDGDWEEKRAGTVIYHPPWQPHAMRTRAAPLAALCLWRGESFARAEFD